MDSRTRRNGEALAQIGFYNPRANPAKNEMPLTLDIEAARLWLGRGAQPTETVVSLLKKAHVFDVPTTGS